MSGLKLFRVEGTRLVELAGSSARLESSIQKLIEDNLESCFGVRFLATEYVTGQRHRGRIDSLGLDENGSPVIVEYKRARNENIVNQGLFYMDWLMDHRAEFKLLVQDKLGSEAAEQIDWRNPRLVCIAGDFTRQDEGAIQQIRRSIELVRYRRFGADLLTFEVVAASTGTVTEGLVQTPSRERRSTRSAGTEKTVTEFLEQASAPLKDLYVELETFAENLGDDVQKRVLKYYFAFRRIKNFACVEVHPRNQTLLVYVRVNPDRISLENGFSRDVRSIGHFGTGDLELRIRDTADLEKAFPLIQQSYDLS